MSHPEGSQPIAHLFSNTVTIEKMAQITLRVIGLFCRAISLYSFIVSNPGGILCINVRSCLFTFWTTENMAARRQEAAGFFSGKKHGINSVL